VNGLNLGIDFRGGVAWEAPVSGDLDLEQARAIVAEQELGDDVRIQVLDASGSQRIRIQTGDQPDTVRVAMQEALASSAGVDAELVSVAQVSSSWGRSITEKAVRALVIFLVIVAAFIAWRFEWKMALAALAAIVHDVLATVGVYALLRFEVTPATVVAFLTILGYSLYDTVVIFDRVKENVERFGGTRTSFANIVNVSTNQVFARSLNTTITSALPVVSLIVVGSWILGATSLQEFAIALLVGMIVGTYSSIFFATPLLSYMKEREPRYAAVANQVATGAEMGALLEHGSAPGCRRRLDGDIVARLDCSRRDASSHASAAAPQTTPSVASDHGHRLAGAAMAAPPHCDGRRTRPAAHRIPREAPEGADRAHQSRVRSGARGAQAPDPHDG
jgi:preprotein translocase subunit SecF